VKGGVEQATLKDCDPHADMLLLRTRIKGAESAPVKGRGGRGAAAMADDSDTHFLRMKLASARCSRSRSPSDRQSRHSSWNRPTSTAEDPLDAFALRTTPGKPAPASGLVP